MEIRVFTAFSGYDSQCMALDRLHQHNPDFTYELVGWAEIDKYAIQAHNAVYPQWAERNYGDISKIDWAQVPDFDLFTYSSPCQDFSQAGKQAGGTEGSGTRSSLLWECRRAILAKRPKYLLMENVAALVSQKFIRLFNAWQLELESYGYRNFSKVLNAKDYGVPQNRERIFMVSVLDETARYEFPDPMPLTIRLKDVLEKEVEERYYLSEQQIEAFNLESMSLHKGLSGKVYETDGSSPTITAGEGVKYNTKILQRGHGYNKGGEFEDVAPTITTSSYENNNHVVEPMIGAFRGRNPENPSERGRSNGMYKQRLEINENGTSNTLTGVQKDNMVIEYGYRIRKLTERECFRLMDVPEEYIDRLMSDTGFIVWNGKKYVQVPRIARSRLYKMAGNSIVVACMYHIWRKLFIDTKIKTLTLF